MYRYLIFQSYNESLKINPQRKDAHLNIGTILHLQVCNFSVNHFSSRTVMSDIHVCTHVGKSVLAVLSVHVHPLCLSLLCSQYMYIHYVCLKISDQLKEIDIPLLLVSFIEIWSFYLFFRNTTQKQSTTITRSWNKTLTT